MFSKEINKIELCQVAKEFRSLLYKYSDAYPDAKNVLQRASSLIDKAINGQIDSPYRQGFLPEEFWESGSLFNIEDLSEACAQFSLLLKGAISIDTIKMGVHSIERQAVADEKQFKN